MFISSLKRKDINMKNQCGLARGCFGKLLVIGAVALASLPAFSQSAKFAEPLADAITRCDVDAVRDLLKEGASPTVPDKGGFLPLLSAALVAGTNPKAVDIIDLLLDAHADIDAPSGPGVTPLVAAAMNGTPAVVTHLLDKGADINWGRQYGETALWQSSRRGTVLAAEILIRRGAEVNTQSGGMTPLHLASLNGMASVVTLLLEKGAKLNARDAQGKTPLAWAEGHGPEDLYVTGETKEVIKILIEHGAKE
jgi:serine/threonine-protein phosphatase 6 regulatory ankyrin repeat subunit B